MKKISSTGVALGIVLGVVAGMLSGSWIFWLGTGLAIGMLIGSLLARRPQVQDPRTSQEAKV
jgi:hypothetical protein